MRIITITSGFEITDTIRNLKAIGHVTLEQLLIDMEEGMNLMRQLSEGVRKELKGQALKAANIPTESTSTKFDTDAFLDKLIEENKKKGK